MISITERKRRYEDLAYAMGSCEMEGCIFTAEYAMGSCEMEGCIFTAETRKLYERYANGELSLKELGDEIDKTLPKK